MSELELNVQIEGADEIKDKANAEKIFGTALKTVLFQGALTIQRRTIDFSPYRTGRLESSWAATWDTSEYPKWSMVGTNVEYARPLEFSGKRPRIKGRIPFFQPAVMESREDIARLCDEAKQAIEAEWAK